MKNPTENQVERRRAIERERQYTSEERRALTSFIERVETLGERTRPHLGTLDTEALLHERDRGDLTSLKQVYEETMMVLPHWAHETPIMSIAQTFGADLATAVEDADRLQSTLQRRLVRAARRARAKRANRIDALDRMIAMPEAGAKTDVASVNSKTSDPQHSNQDHREVHTAPPSGIEAEAGNPIMKRVDETTIQEQIIRSFLRWVSRS